MFAQNMSHSIGTTAGLFLKYFFVLGAIRYAKLAQVFSRKYPNENLLLEYFLNFEGCYGTALVKKLCILHDVFIIVQVKILFKTWRF